MLLEENTGENWGKVTVEVGTSFLQIKNITYCIVCPKLHKGPSLILIKYYTSSSKFK